RFSDVSYRTQPSISVRSYPEAINIRLVETSTVAIPFLNAIDRTRSVPDSTEARISVPGKSGRREFFTRTGIPLSIAGARVSGCRTRAPKYASSEASSKEIVGIGRAPG